MSRSRAPKQNRLPTSLSFYRENLEFGPLFLSFLAQIHFQENQRQDPAARQVPTGAVTPPCQSTRPPRKPFQSLSVASLHANRVHWPGLMACRRGLGHRLQLLLGLPDVMELLELLHHAVFEVWV